MAGPDQPQRVPEHASCRSRRVPRLVTMPQGLARSSPPGCGHRFGGRISRPPPQDRAPRFGLDSRGGEQAAPFFSGTSVQAPRLVRRAVPARTGRGPRPRSSPCRHLRCGLCTGRSAASGRRGLGRRLPAARGDLRRPAAGGRGASPPADSRLSNLLPHCRSGRQDPRRRAVGVPPVSLGGRFT